MTSKRLESINEISIRNEIPFLNVMEIYTRFSAKIYTRALLKKENTQLYNPILEDKIFKLTERYYDIKNVRDLKFK